MCQSGQPGSAGMQPTSQASAGSVASPADVLPPPSPHTASPQSTELLGKPQGQDLASGNLTAPAIYALQVR